MTTRLSGFLSEAGRADYLAAYDRVLADLWPVSTESILVESGFGTTHAIASGPMDAPPMMLLHAAGLSATQWYPGRAMSFRDPASSFGFPALIKPVSGSSDIR